MSGDAGLAEAASRFLFRLSEQAEPTVTAGILHEALGDQAANLIGKGCLVAGRNRDSVLISLVGGDDVDVPVEFDHQSGTFRCFHPESGFVSVDAMQLRTYTLDLQRLSLLVRDLLGLPGSTSSRVLVEGLLWDLGEDYLTQRKFPIYLARRLGWAESFEKIVAALNARRGLGPGLVLALGGIPSHLALPREFRAVALADTLVSGQSGLRVKKAILRGVLLGETASHERGPLSHSADCSVVKGVEGFNRSAPVSGPTFVDATEGGKKVRKGARLWTVAVSTFKSETYRFLRLDRPTDEELTEGARYPAGTVHLPSWADAEWCKQLVAEQLVTVKTRRGFAKLEWQKVRERNEALDCRVYARAAAWILGADRWAEGKWKDLEKQLGVTATEPTDDPQAAPYAGVVRRPVRRGRKVFRSSYMG